MSEYQQQSIINALMALPLRSDARDGKVLQSHAAIIQTYLYMVAKGRWQPATPKQVVKELEAYSRALRVLTQKVELLSEAALDMLEKTYVSEEAQGKFRREPERIAENILRQPEPSALGNLPGCLLPNCHEYLLHAARRAADNLRDSAEDKRGPQIDSAAHWLAGRLAETYFNLTGEKPRRLTDRVTDKMYGPFFDLVETCFKLAGLNAGTEHYARAAEENFKKFMDASPRK